jgi:hypothetical protein
MRFNQCIVCGIETAQGSICALCNAGITRMHDELMKLLKMDNNRNLLKKLNIGERNQRLSLN